ncbi:MAG: von Willebrand factor type A domain-containing protein [Candidatus Didemnitutus sp.]|nr:von Willebrand factor type A domain-containing protein [Candidatus Didemnitutus sp.]
MKISEFNQDDPRLTAYALDEMEPAERAEFERWLQQHPEAQKAVEEIRAAAAMLGEALAEEPAGADNLIDAAAVLAAQPKAEPVDEYRRKRSKLLQFPALYYMTASLAAACFAVMFFTSAEYSAKEQKRYIEMNETMADAMRAKEKGKRMLESEERALAAQIQSQEQTPRPAVTFALPSTPPPPPPTDAAQVALAGASSNQVASGDVAFSTPLELRANQGNEMVKLEQFAVTSAAQTTAGAAQEPMTFGYSGPVGARPAAARMSSPLSAKRAPALLTGGLVLPQTEPSNTESYAHTEENPFLTVAQNPLSTFSVDVDTASYANVRRFLQQKHLPPKGAVRIEELVNYFPYRYAPPSDRAPFAAHLEVASAPWAPEHRLVRIGLKGREVSDAARPKANLVFLLDVSGSMNAANKLPLVKQSLRMMLEKLRTDDRVAIVVYAGASGMALPSTPVREKAKIISAIDQLQAEGSTNGAAGIQLAYDIAKANFVTGGVNRVVLATDGDFNLGVSDESQLTDLIQEKAKSGVFLSVLGFGMGNYKDSTLEQLADKGNGNYAYIDSLAEAKKTLVEQAGGTLVTIAKDVKLQVEFNPAVAQAYRLIGYENRLLRKEDFNNDNVDAGEIGAGHTVTALYEVIPVGVPMPEAGSVDALKYQKAGSGERGAGNMARASGELLTLKVRYKEPAGDVSTKLEFPLRDTGKAFADASADFKFAAAVAAFGMRLKNSPHHGEASFAAISEWAREGTGDDTGGYRAEFVELVDEASSLAEN